MTNAKCDLSNPNFSYFYCPSYAAAVLFAILFSITTAAHVYQGYLFRKPFTWVLIMGGVWEIVGYAIRTVSIHNPLTSGLYTAQMLLILLAPLWINAFIYMLIGRAIHFFLEDDRVFGIKARKLTLIFVIFDITAFLVQGTGGSMSSDDDMQAALNGLHIYTAGVALQILFNAIFLAVVVKFQMIAMPVLAQSHVSVPLDPRGSPNASPVPFVRSLRDCVFLLRLTFVIVTIILFRNFYRLAEFASGLNNTIIRHEWYAYVFDAVPMFFAMVILNIFHIGTKLQGPRSDFSEETRERKQAKKERKEAKKMAKMGGRMDKKSPNISTHEILDHEQV